MRNPSRYRRVRRDRATGREKIRLHGRRAVPHSQFENRFLLRLHQQTACRRFSRAYIAHLFRARELLAYRLATAHNLTFTLDFMARIRAAIGAGRLPDELPALRARAARTEAAGDATMAGEAAGEPA